MQRAKENVAMCLKPNQNKGLGVSLSQVKLKEFRYHGALNKEDISQKLCFAAAQGEQFCKNKDLWKYGKAHTEMLVSAK